MYANVSFFVPENFDVGQNIAYLDKSCIGPGQCNLQLNSVPDWSYVLKMFFDEVAVFDKKYINSIVFVPGKDYGHFTQVITHAHKFLNERYFSTRITIKFSKEIEHTTTNYVFMGKPESQYTMHLLNLKVKNASIQFNSAFLFEALTIAMLF